MVTYQNFIESKQQALLSCGFDVDDENINGEMFGWQRDVTKWSLKKGRAALFEECGLGKTIQQLEWARHVVQKTGLPVILYCPVGVRQQTLKESKKFGISRQVVVSVVDSQEEVKPGSIAITNYDRMHKFDCDQFGGVVLDESSILKNFAGKRKKQLVESHRQTPYRLCCTATPAPNDHMELGTHAEFLGICEREAMLSRFFVHDSGNTAKWRLKKHSVKDFWRWVSSWAVCISKPSDIGGDDEGFELPELRVERHVVNADNGYVPSGMLFNNSGISATNIHEEKRLTCSARVDRAVKIVKEKKTACIVWCDTNYEADELKNAMPNAIEVRGTDSIKEKETKLEEFTKGKKVIITKPSIAGFGMNWQHCNRQIFTGLSYSFEAYYQAVRRSWRFGQKKPVDVHIVIANSESAIESAVSRKESDYEIMKSGMSEAMKESMQIEFFGSQAKQRYSPSENFELPHFLGESK